MEKKLSILEEVTQSMARWKKMNKANPNDPALGPLRAEIEAKQETPEYKDALAEEEQRMTDELKKLFRA